MGETATPPQYANAIFPWSYTDRLTINYIYVNICLKIFFVFSNFMTLPVLPDPRKISEPSQNGNISYLN
jgi:hypothetical protein